MIKNNNNKKNNCKRSAQQKYKPTLSAFTVEFTTSQSCAPRSKVGLCQYTYIQKKDTIVKLMFDQKIHTGKELQSKATEV